MDYGRPIQFGVFIIPDATQPTRALEQAVVADELGFDLIGVQDHPYQRRFHDTWTLLIAMAMRTKRVSVFLADGWVPSLGYLKPADFDDANARIDDAAGAWGREPAVIRRVINVGGSLTADDFAVLALEHGFDSFMVGEDGMQEFAAEVAPRARELVAAGRGSR